MFTKRVLFAILVAIAFSPLASATSSGLTMVDGTWAFTNADEGKIVELNHNNSILASSHSNNLTLFDTSTQMPIKTFEFDREIKALDFSPDGKTLAVSKDVVATKDDTLRLIDMEELVVKTNYATADEKVNDIAWSSDSSTIAAPRSDGDVSIFNGNDLSLTRTLAGVHNTDVTCIDYSLDGKYILTGDESGRYVIWNVSGGKLGQHSNFGEGLVDCIFTKNSLSITLMGKSGTLIEKSLDGAILKQQNVIGGMKIIYSANSTYLNVGYSNDNEKGLTTLDALDFSSVLETRFFHLVEDLAIIYTDTDKIDTIYVATDTGQVAIYKRDYHPPGFGDSGTDLDGDHIPDIIDEDDDGDGIFDQWDNGIGCDAPANISCSKYPDLTKIRRVEFNFGEVLTIYDRITLPTEESSHIRNMSRVSIADDNKVSSSEGQLFADSVCANMDRDDVISQWKNSIVLSSGSISNGRVDCELDGGMVLVKIDDHSTQISLVIVTTFLINSEIELPLNLTIIQQPLPSEGSIAWIAPSHPMSVKVTGDDCVSDSIELWWNDGNEVQLQLKQIVKAEPTQTEVILSIALHPLMISLYLVISLFGLLYLVRRDNKIDLDLFEDDTVEEELIESEEIEEIDQIYDEYLDEEVIVRPKRTPPVKKEIVTFNDDELKEKATPKRRRVKSDGVLNKDGPIMMTKRRRLAEQEPVAKVVGKKRVVASSVKNPDKVVVKTRRVKTSDSYAPKEEVLEEPKKKKKRKPVKRKGKKPEKIIDENELQKGLLNDFAVEDSD
tara:strand:+ start:1077 stop:3413 length:2337 start_codon:yes stop_codon:yes gene_type:complete